MLDRLLHRSVVLNLDGNSDRFNDDHARSGAFRKATTGTRQPLQSTQLTGEHFHRSTLSTIVEPRQELMRSITWDRATEMAGHLAAADKLGAPVYFCDSRSPWQRASNENSNGLLRDYFRPKCVTLRRNSQEHPLAVEDELNNHPRMVLQTVFGGSIPRPASLGKSVGVAM